MFGKGKQGVFQALQKWQVTGFYMSATNNKLLMCWEKSYFKRFDFLAAIPAGNSRDEVLSQK